MVRLVEYPVREAGGARLAPRSDPAAPALPLKQFEVTSESVVATVVLQYEDSHRSVQINWGDDNVEEIDLLNPPLRQGQSVPPGTLRLQHVYDIEKLTSRFIVVALTRDRAGGRTLNAEAIDIRPRYFIVQDPVKVDLLPDSNEIFEGYTHEYDISQRLFQRGQGELVNRTWRLEAKIGGWQEGSIGPWIYELEDSSLAIHMDWEDGEVLYHFDVREDDGLWGTVKATWEVLSHLPVEFDTSTTIAPELHPRVFPLARQSSVTWRLHKEVLDGYVDVIVKFEATLDVPLDRGPVLQQ